MIVKRRQLIKGGITSLASLLIAQKAFAASGGMAARGESLIFNAGVGGNNTVDLLRRIDQDCLALKPSLTILMAGTNDMNSAKHVPLPDFERNLDTLAGKIVAAGSKLLMVTILPSFDPDLLTRHPAAFYAPEGVAGRRKQVNDVVRKVARKRKAHVLDLEHRFAAIGNISTDKDSLLQNEANTNKRDGIHPTPTGYKFIGLTIYDTIVNLGLPADRIVCFGDSITKGDGSMDGNSYPAYLKKLLSNNRHDQKNR